jgi:hypothetical protein
MALKKVEISDELLRELGATKSPKELGETMENYVNAGMECTRFPKDNVMLYNVILDLATRLGKEQEANTLVKEALKEINLKLMSEL